MKRERIGLALLIALAACLLHCAQQKPEEALVIINRSAAQIDSADE